MIAIACHGISEQLHAGPVVIATERYAREDVAIAGVTIPRHGEKVLAVLAPANRDERRFTSPVSLDIMLEPNNRTNTWHSGLGLTPARMHRSPGWKGRSRSARCSAAPGALRWRRGLLLRGVESPPVSFDRRGAGAGH